MTVFPLSYGLATLLAALLTVLALLLCARRTGWRAGIAMAVLAPVLCFLGARGYYILVCDLIGPGFWGPLFPQEPYFYAFSGGVLGFVTAVWLTARMVKKPFSRLADAFTPAGLVGAAAFRLTEALSDFGWGDMLDAAWLQRYPFAIQNMYGEWCGAVFNLEALCALGVLVYVLIRKTPGRRLPVALIWWAATQIFCESLRVESIQWGFVRVQQLQSAIFIAVVMLVFMCRNRSLRKDASAWLVFAVCIGVVIFAEYAIDKMPWVTWLNYAGMAVAVAVMGCTAQKVVLASEALA